MEDLAMHKGTVPWSPDAYLEALAWLRGLRRTPKDDWDLATGNVQCAGQVGNGAVLPVNPFRVAGQLHRYLLRQYGEHGRHHLFRLVQIQDFLHDHRAALLRDGLAFAAEDGSARVSYQLLQALCELPYSHAGSVEDEACYFFDYAEVRTHARCLARPMPAKAAARAR